MILFPEGHQVDIRQTLHWKVENQKSYLKVSLWIPVDIYQDMVLEPSVHICVCWRKALHINFFFNQAKILQISLSYSSDISIDTKKNLFQTSPYKFQNKAVNALLV